MKRTLFFLHSWMGLVAGLGLVLIGLTGSVIVFKDELDQVLVPHLVKTTTAESPRLMADDFLATVRTHLPEGLELTGWGRSDRAGFADTLYLTRQDSEEGKYLYVDPTTAKPQGGPLSETDSVTSMLVSLHYSFLAGHVGEAIAGVFGLLLLLLGISGFWLYRGFWKTFFLLRWGRTARIFFSDLHKMVGISSMLFNLVLGFTGAWWNLSHLIGHLLEEKPDANAQPTAAVIAAEATPPPKKAMASLEVMMQMADESLPGFAANWISMPAESQMEDRTVTLWGSVAGQSFLRSKYGSTVQFNADTGALIEAKDIRKAGAWDQVLDSFRPLHFGDFGGLPVKILWSLGGLTPGILAVSGSLMWLARRKPKRRRAPGVIQAA